MINYEYDTVVSQSQDEMRALQPTSDEHNLPDYLWVAESPERVDEAEKVSLSQIEQRLNFRFSEKLWAMMPTS